MPYIKPEDRLELDDGVPPTTPGELNYLITVLVSAYWERAPRYNTIAEITGVLENVKQEFYRRIAVKYEDEAMKRNGDVY